MVSALDSGRDYPDYRIVVSLIPDIVFSWVPSHAGIPVNEVADQLTRDSLSVPFFSLLPSVPRFIKSRFKSYELFKAVHPIPLAFDFHRIPGIRTNVPLARMKLYSFVYAAESQLYNCIRFALVSFRLSFVQPVLFRWITFLLSAFDIMTYADASVRPF